MADILELIGGILLIITSIILIVSIALQEGGKGGLGALSGDSESYVGKNGDKITKILSVVFVLVSLALYIITSIMD